MKNFLSPPLEVPLLRPNLLKHGTSLFKTCWYRPFT